MTNSRNPEADEIPLGDLFRPLASYRRLIWQATLATALIVALLAGLYWWFQPTSWSASLGFRPVFDGAEKGTYPNGLAFAGTDVVNQTIIDQVVARNGFQEYCPLPSFASAFFVQEMSPSLQFLDLDYQARLADTRLTVVERQRLQDEYASRRTAISREYQLSFVQPGGCARVPQPIAFKALGEILETWANDSQQKRGVLKVRIATLSPGVFDQAGVAGEALLVRADLVRSAMVRVAANIAEVEKLPGAELVRAGKNQASFAEIRTRIEDLMLARLDPLIGEAGSGLGRASLRWVEQALETASAQLRAAEKRTETYREALREYSGITRLPSSSAANAGDTNQRSTDVQALTPQIDRTFIEGIVALSAANTAFRQEITRQMIIASIESVDRAAVVEHYRGLLASMKGSSNGGTTPEQIAKRLAVITAEAKEATRAFNEVYDEFSRIALRAGSALYRVERPASAVAVKAFSVRAYGMLVLAVLLAAPIVFGAMFLAGYHLRRFIQNVR